MPDPKKNTAYTFYISLIDSSNRPDFIADPTIAAGDFQVSTDGSAFANLTTLPVVDPAGSTGVKIALSAGEMNGDRIMVQCIRVSDGEWDDVLIYIDTTIVTVDEIGVAGAGLTAIAVGVGGIQATSFASGAIDAASIAADATTEITAGIRIKKNTALSNFMFLMVDSTDHVTPKTGLTITATRSIDGTAFGACANAASEVANGIYKINLADTDLNGDVITFKFTGGATADNRLLTVITTV